MHEELELDVLRSLAPQGPVVVEAGDPFGDGDGRDVVEEADDASRVAPGRQDGRRSCVVMSWSLREPSGAVDAAEADVARAGVDHLGPTCGRPVTQAVGVRAQVRAALDHPTADPELRLRRVVALVLVAARGFTGTQQGLSTSSGWRWVHQSAVHSQTLPPCRGGRSRWRESSRPVPVPTNPLSRVLRHGKSGPSHVFAMILPSGRASSPHV
jgi:hypothetical protein